MIKKWKNYDFKNKKQYCRTLYRQIKRYCEDPESKLYKYLGKEGIRCDFGSSRELYYLYDCYRVDQMENPWFVRKNSKKNFTTNDCLFIDDGPFRRAVYDLRLASLRGKAKTGSEIRFKPVKQASGFWIAKPDIRFVLR